MRLKSSYFASVCILAIIAEAKTRDDFNLERTFLERDRA